MDVKLEKADVLIIGGGIHGSSLAYYLAKNNKSVILVEKSHIGAEASGRNGGGVRQQNRDPREAGDSDHRKDPRVVQATGVLLQEFGDDKTGGACSKGVYGSGAGNLIHLETDGHRGVNERSNRSGEHGNGKPNPQVLGDSSRDHCRLSGHQHDSLNRDVGDATPFTHHTA